MRAVLLAVAVAFVGGCGGKKGDRSGEPVEEKGAVAGLIDLQVLAQDYRTNEASADAKYTRRRVTCEGLMHNVERTDGGAYVMSFEYFVDGFNMAKGVVYAYFPASEADKLKRFEFRSPVHFTGRCDGWEKTGVPPFVAIRDCRIVATPPKGGGKPTEPVKRDPEKAP